MKVGVQIPLDHLSGVTAVTAEMKGFDPNDATDVQSFPGTFQGTGDTNGQRAGVSTNTGATAQADEEVYQLISSSFARIDLQDQNGDDLTLTEPEAEAASDGENPKIHLHVPASSYATITSDMSGDDTGVQVPIYVYNGSWQLIGLGTLIQFDGNGDAQLYASAGDPIIPSAYDAQQSGDIYVEIEIVAGNEWIQWVNLDWPIKAGDTLVDVTITGQLVYDARKIENRELYNGSAQIFLPNGGQEL